MLIDMVGESALQPWNTVHPKMWFDGFKSDECDRIRHAISHGIVALHGASTLRFLLGILNSKV